MRESGDRVRLEGRKPEEGGRGCKRVRACVRVRVRIAPTIERLGVCVCAYGQKRGWEGASWHANRYHHLAHTGAISTKLYALLFKYVPSQSTIWSDLDQQIHHFSVLYIIV